MSLAFSRLQQLISPTLPIGSFTYSQGMEWANEFSWIEGAEGVEQWIGSVMHDGMLYFDLPLLIHLYKACEENNSEKFSYYSNLTMAGRETYELRLEEKQRARAFLAVLEKLPKANEYVYLIKWKESLKESQIACFAMACFHWKIILDDALQGYLWSWLENMVTVAVKLVPLGQTDGQRILFDLSTEIETLCEQSKLILDHEIGASNPALAIASSQHETQYCRIFRS
jgi:urease accessory protein